MRLSFAIFDYSFLNQMLMQPFSTKFCRFLQIPIWSCCLFSHLLYSIKLDKVDNRKMPPKKRKRNPLKTKDWDNRWVMVAWGSVGTNLSRVDTIAAIRVFVNHHCRSVFRLLLLYTAWFAKNWSSPIPSWSLIISSWLSKSWGSQSATSGRSHRFRWIHALQ